MERQAYRRERVVGGRAPDGFRRVGALEPELAGRSAGCQILVCTGRDAGVQSYRDGRDPPQRPSGRCDVLELVEGFDVQRPDADLDRRVDLVLALPDP